MFIIFFFKQKTSYDMRISDWSSDVCSSDLYPVIATTSKLMTTGVDAQTCKLVVLDQHIKSMTEFKQIIGRGTRINEDFGKYWFTIMDFKKATERSEERSVGKEWVSRCRYRWTR